LKIKNLKINGFGNLEEKEIEFNENINIIYGKNEAGKSTLLKFIVDMFYGISKNKRGKDIADFEKYTPWKASEFSGKLNYELDSGEIYEIFRDFNKKNPKIFNIKGEDISKNFNIDKTKGNEFFEEQTGIDEDLFLSTFVSQQQEVKLNSNEKTNLIQKMSNIVSTGEDNVSYKKAIEKINRKLIEEVGTERTQGRPINIILEKLKKLKIKKEELLISKINKNNINEEKENIKNNINKINNEINFLNEFKKLINNKILEQEKININKKIIDEENKKIINLKKELENNKKENKINKKINIKNNLIFTGILIIINIILFILFKNIIINSAIAGITIIYVIYYLFKNKKINIENKKIINEKNKLIEKLNNEIEILNNNLIEKNNEINLLENNLINNFEKEKNKLKNAYISKIENITNLLTKENIDYEIEYRINVLNEEKVSLHKLEIIENETKNNENELVEIEEQIENLEEEKEDLSSLAESINLAKEYLEKANIKMKESISPKFTRNLSEIISKISDEKYNKIKLDDSGNLILEKENGDYISVERLSTGTIDQIYLSLRLGVLEELTEEKLPIILDESFAYFDKERLKNILIFLNENYKDSQIIILTCTEREKEMFEELNMEYNYIEL